MIGKIFCRVIVTTLIVFAFSFMATNPASALVKSSFIINDTQADHEKRIKKFTEEIKSVDPNDKGYLASLYDLRGLNYTVLEQYENAVSDITKAIQIYDNLDKNKWYGHHNEYAEKFWHRGEAYSYWGKYNEALADYNKAVQLDRKSGYHYRGEFYLRWKKYREAISDFTECIQLESDRALYYYNRGLCYQELGDNAHAQADFKKAKELGYNG